MLLSQLLLLGCASQPMTPMTISYMVVRDSEFRVIRTIKSPAQIQKINALWQRLEPMTELPNTNWTHKLDIQANVRSGRWLYNNQDGYLAKLNYRLRPRYKVADPKVFNKVILGF